MIPHHDPASRSSYGKVSGANYYNYPRYSGSYTYHHKGPDSMVYVLPSDSNDTSISNEPITKNAGSRWREDETEALVEIWRDKICQTRWWKQSKGVRVNKEMWEEIAKILSEKGIHRTPSQCQIRMKNLLQFYRQTIDNRRAEKSMDELPEYFDIVDSIMTRRDAFVNEGTEKNPYADVAEGISMVIDENNNENERKNSYEESLSPPADNNKNSMNTSKVDVEQLKKEENTVPLNSTSTASNGHPKSASMSSHSPHQNRSPPSHWEQSSSGYCDPQEATSTKKVNSDREYQTHSQDMSKRYTPYTRHYVRAPNNQHERRYMSHVNIPMVSQIPHAQKMAYPPPHVEGGEWGGYNNHSVSIRFIQELLNLQYKQMDNFLEIEKKRLEIEQKRLEIEQTRLGEEKESMSRNSAFLMEAVKILAESFRKDENETKK